MDFQPSTGRSLLRSLILQSARVVWARVFKDPLEYLPQASAQRLVWSGVFVIVAHGLFGVAWTEWFPQPFESTWLRLVFGALGLIPIYIGLSSELSSRRSIVLLSMLFWLELPFFGFYMYFQNGRSSIWLATTVAMIVIYHNLTDWRIASLGSLLALVISSSMHTLTLGDSFYVTSSSNSDWKIDMFVIGFGWAVGIKLGLSSTGRQKDLLTQAQTTMGIVAHELRTPLSSMGLIVNSIDKVADQLQDRQSSNRLYELSARIERLTAQMNHQIDTQITNARPELLPTAFVTIRASSLIEETLTNYPFKSQQESTCLHVHVSQDFCFLGPQELMSQVISNLVKNSIEALRRANSTFGAKSLAITTYTEKEKGFISVQDKGIGIEPHVLRSIFNPFFSTNHDRGHGLGLTFCKKVVGTCNGKLSVTSQRGEGACFVISLPLKNTAI